MRLIILITLALLALSANAGIKDVNEWYKAMLSKGNNGVIK
jgi:hypothetical protein